jgi:hypothetical protein
MRTQLRLLVLSATVAGVITPQAADQPGPLVSPPTAQAQTSSRLPTRVDPQSASPGVAEILKLFEAGISKEIIKAYIESGNIPLNVTSDDLILLKQRGVPDDITAALLKRNTELRAPSNATGSPVPAVPAAASTSRVLVSPGIGGLDPEGYDYFRYYYLYPRTLAAAYQRLSGPPFQFGYTQPYPFVGPGYPLGYAPLRRYWPR